MLQINPDNKNEARAVIFNDEDNEMRIVATWTRDSGEWLFAIAELEMKGEDAMGIERWESMGEVYTGIGSQPQLAWMEKFVEVLADRYIEDAKRNT